MAVARTPQNPLPGPDSNPGADLNRLTVAGKQFGIRVGIGEGGLA
jgi:hypothetical protein